MKTKDLIIAGAVVLGVVTLFPKIGQAVGSGVGQTAGGAVGGVTTGLVQGVLIDPYEWALNYEGYIPIIDPLAKTFANIKNFGNPDHWFW